MSRSLTAITYRKLMVEGRRLDQDAARRGLLCASAQQFYDHYTNKWSSVEKFSEMRRAGVAGGESGAESQYIDDRKYIDPLIRELNFDRDWYHPPAKSPAQQFSFETAAGMADSKADTTTTNVAKSQTPTSLQGMIRREFRKTSAQNNLTVAFTALKQLSNISAVCKDRVPAAVPFDGVDYGFKVVDGRTKASLELAMRDAGDSHALCTAVRQRQLSLMASHPVLHGFFRHSLILISGCTKTGSVGFIINKPLIFNNMCVPVWSVIGSSFHPLFTESLAQNPVMLGGPVASPASRQQALYILHRIPGITGAFQMAPNLYMSGSYDELHQKIKSKEISSKDIMVMMGYSGWGVSQLEGEALAGSWIALLKDATSNSGAADGGASEDSKKLSQEEIEALFNAISATEKKETPKEGADEKEKEGSGDDAAKKSKEAPTTKKSDSTPSAFDMFNLGNADETSAEDEDLDKRSQEEKDEENRVRRSLHMNLVSRAISSEAAKECSDLVFATHLQCHDIIRVQNLGDDVEDDDDAEGKEENAESDKAAAGQQISNGRAGLSGSTGTGGSAPEKPLWDNFGEFAKTVEEKTQKEKAEKLKRRLRIANEEQDSGSSSNSGDSAAVEAKKAKKLTPEEVSQRQWVQVVGGLSSDYSGLTRLAQLTLDPIYPTPMEDDDDDEDDD